MAITFLKPAEYKEQNDLYFYSERDVNALPASQRQQRLAYYEDQEKFLEWCPVYLPNTFSVGYGRHHELQAQALQLRGELVVVLVPRGFGKTTMALSFLIHSLCYGRDPYILWIDHDLKTARRQILSVSKAMTENPRILADYGIRPGNIWRPFQGEMTFDCSRNPYATHSEVYVRFSGAQEIARGTTFDFSRISLVILNDVVKGSREAVSQSWNDFIESFVTKDLMFAGESISTLSIIFITTIQATHDISDRLSQNHSAYVMRQPAVDGDDNVVKSFVEYVSDDMPNIKQYIRDVKGEPPNLKKKELTPDDRRAYCESRPEYARFFEQLVTTWPAHPLLQMWDYVFEIYATGSLAWLQERQHVTGDSHFVRFPFHWFQPYTIDAIPDGDRRYLMTIDWSGLPKEGTDPKAIWAGCYHQDRDELYTLAVWCDRATHEDAFEQMYATFWQAFPWYQGANVDILMEDIISATGISLVYFETLREKRITDGGNSAYWQPLPIRTFHAKERGDKLSSIDALRPFIEQRRFFYIPNHSHQNLMLTQFSNYVGKHTHAVHELARKIDIPDTVAMAKHHIDHGRASIAPTPPKQDRIFQRR